jgi:hypothetical protein
MVFGSEVGSTCFEERVPGMPPTPHGSQFAGLGRATSRAAWPMDSNGVSLAARSDANLSLDSRTNRSWI